MTKRTHRIRLDDDDDDPEEPTHRPRRRIAREPVADADDNPRARQYGHGESRLPRQYDNPSRGNFLLEENRGVGRPKGSVNRFTRHLKEALELSTQTAGEELTKQGHRYSDNPTVNYLTWLALNEPASHARLIGIVTPKVHHTSPDPNSTFGQLLEAARARLAMEKSKVLEAKVVEGDRWKREYRR
jgi:hypothetical protein